MCVVEIDMHMRENRALRLYPRNPGERLLHGNKGGIQSNMENAANHGSRTIIGQMRKANKRHSQSYRIQKANPNVASFPLPQEKIRSPEHEILNKFKVCKFKTFRDLKLGFLPDGRVRVKCLLTKVPRPSEKLWEWHLLGVLSNLLERLAT